MVPYELLFAEALAATVAVETVALWVFFKLGFFKPAGKNPLQIVVFAGFFPSFATLPYLWFVLPAFYHGAYYAVFGEVFAIFVECFILARVLGLNLGKAFVLSLACNFLSFAFGLLFFSYAI